MTTTSWQFRCILCFLLLGCTTPDKEVAALGWDPDLYEYAVQFQSDMEVRGVHVATGQVVTLIVSDRDVDDCEDWMDDLAGCCIFTESTRGLRGGVYVRSGYVLSYTRTVVYHELTHCTTGLDHTEEKGAIMNETVPWIAEDKWEQALDALALFIREGRGCSQLREEICK